MSAKLLNTFVNTVKELLHSQKLSQTELAQKLGVSRQTVSQFITGEHAPRVDKIEDIASALGVPAFYLLMTPEQRAFWDSKKAPEPSLEQIQKDVATIKQTLLGLDKKADDCMEQTLLMKNFIKS